MVYGSIYKTQTCILIWETKPFTRYSSLMGQLKDKEDISKAISLVFLSYKLIKLCWSSVLFVPSMIFLFFLIL